MPNHNGNGRNVALPDENRQSWRPQDEPNGPRHRRSMDDGERYNDDRYMRGHWEDHSERGWDREADHDGQGQSGYGSGRQQGDRSISFQSRNQGYPGTFEDRCSRDRYARPDPGNDERFARRGSAYYDRGYDMRRGEQDRSDRHHLGTGGSMQHPTGYGSPGPESQATGYQGDRQLGGHRGKGPTGYRRSDERIRELVCEAFTDHDHLDATHIEVIVKAGEVMLTGTVENRQQKRLAEDIVEQVAGVKDVQNQIRVGSEKNPGSTGIGNGREPHDSMSPDSKRHRA